MQQNVSYPTKLPRNKGEVKVSVLVTLLLISAMLTSLGLAGIWFLSYSLPYL